VYLSTAQKYPGRPPFPPLVRLVPLLVFLLLLVPPTVPSPASPHQAASLTNQLAGCRPDIEDSCSSSASSASLSLLSTCHTLSLALQGKVSSCRSVWALFGCKRDFTHSRLGRTPSCSCWESVSTARAIFQAACMNASAPGRCTIAGHDGNVFPVKTFHDSVKGRWLACRSVFGTCRRWQDQAVGYVARCFTAPHHWPFISFYFYCYYTRCKTSESSVREQLKVCSLCSYCKLFCF
jgi:hypothetical protein